MCGEMLDTIQIRRLHKDKAVDEISAWPGMPTAPTHIVQHAATAHNERPLITLSMARPLGKQQRRRG